MQHRGTGARMTPAPRISSGTSVGYAVCGDAHRPRGSSGVSGAHAWPISVTGLPTSRTAGSIFSDHLKCWSLLQTRGDSQGIRKRTFESGENGASTHLEHVVYMPEVGTPGWSGKAVKYWRAPSLPPNYFAGIVQHCASI